MGDSVKEYSGETRIRIDLGHVELRTYTNDRYRCSNWYTPDEARELARLLRKHASLAEGQEVDE